MDYSKYFKEFEEAVRDNDIERMYQIIERFYNEVSKRFEELRKKIECRKCNKNKKYVVYLRINNCCNFNCKYCSDRLMFNVSEPKLMDFKTLDGIIKLLDKLNVDCVSIPQREPTYACKHFVSIVDTLNDAGITVRNITTNGYNISQHRDGEDILKVLQENNTHVLLSFDGIWQDVYRLHISGKPTAHAVLETIQLFKEYDISFDIACTVVNPHLKLLYANYKYLKQYCDSVAFNIDCVSQYKVTDLDLLYEQFKLIAEEDMTVFPLWKIKMYYKSGSPAKLRNKLCGAGRGGFTIDYDGKIAPCYHGQEVWKPILDYLRIDLGDVWNPKLENLEIFKKYDINDPECNKCYSYLCGMCYIYNYYVNGDPLKRVDLKCKQLRVLTKVVTDTLNSLA